MTLWLQKSKLIHMEKQLVVIYCCKVNCVDNSCDGPAYASVTGKLL